MRELSISKPIAYNEQTTIAEMTKGIILASYEAPDVSIRAKRAYQTEAELEDKLVTDLASQGYEKFAAKGTNDLHENLKVQIERLNNTKFNNAEWSRFLNEYLLKPSDGPTEKTRKIQGDHVYDFTFDDERLENILIIDKNNIHSNHLQVASQISQKGSHENRYDVTILVNGLPMVHIELKKRGGSLQEAFQQIHRYKKESFNSQGSLYQYVQIFVISNGTYTKYFANTTANNKNHYEFTCEWADGRNKPISELEDFTATFFEKRTLLEVITKYCVFDANDTLLIMRPYQIAAAERIWWKIRSSYENKRYGSVHAGGFVWHTTGSGKTLTSFKAARLATQLEFIDKVFFVVDRKDLDYQTMKEYESFQPGSVSGTMDTRQLVKSVEKDDGKIVVTTIQKLNQFVKGNKNHSIFNKQCVIIYDECHRSQFGEAQKNIRNSFKKYYQFGFTGTPIFSKNAIRTMTTSEIFGANLHNYVITDAIRDGKVLKFKVDYNNIKAKFKDAETEQDLDKIAAFEKQLLLHPERISEVTNYILKSYPVKTHRNKYYTVKQRSLSGFNAMFAVSSIDAAKLYYDEFARQQKDLPEAKKIKIATIFSYSPNEDDGGYGNIEDEGFEPSALDQTSKEFLDKVIYEYNRDFKTNFSASGGEFQNYYKDLSKRVKAKQVDLLIVVGMFLTGFDAPTLNTLYVDKNLRYHGLLQAYSRTNRILNKVKAFGNIVCFRDLEDATRESIRTFGSENDINIILEKSYEEYMNGFTDEERNEKVKGYTEICKELIEKFPDPTKIALDSDKAEFAQLFGELLKAENILRNFDEFADNEKIIPEGLMQDMRSVYVDIREYFQKFKDSEKSESTIDFADIEFEIELLKTDEINLDYILALILEKSKERQTDDIFKEDIRRTIRSSLGVRAKEELVMEYIDATDLKTLRTNEDILESFHGYARRRKKEEIRSLAASENLQGEFGRYIDRSIENGYADAGGGDLDALLPPTSRIGGAREKKKSTVLEKIQKLVEVFIGI